MLMAMEDQIKIFIQGLRVWAKIKPKKSQTELAKIIGKSQPTISDYFKGEYYPDMDLVNLWIDHYNLNFKEILNLGRTELQPPQDIDQHIEAKIDAKFKAYTDKLPTNPPHDLQKWKSQKNKDHHKKIDEFNDQETALNINSILVEIEKIDKKVFRKIESYVRLELNSIKGDRELRGEELQPNGTGK
jgi:transcriptional regulator with XRE-family HTH domain